MPRDSFPRVKEARELLRQKAAEILEKHMAIIEEARQKGEFEAALKASQWLIEHMPNEEGSTVIDSSAAKQKEVVATNSGPIIQIGFKLGGMGEPALPIVKEVKELKK
jgi:hypothetical protein